ncbi:MAG: tetratricopeptide repeat protein [Candidatus Hydrogenedentes bacterium]|nr:tetratricopeptide repeat protein [Candidatus Hydrogenedentota bacterium]
MIRHATGLLIVFLSLVSFPHLHLAAQDVNSSEYNNQGVEAYNTGDYSKAISLLEKAYALAPDSDVVRHNLRNSYQGMANTYGEEKDFRKAIPYLDRAVKIDPNHAPLRTQLGTYHLNVGDVNAGIYHIEEAIRLNPGDLTAHEMLGQAYYMDNDLASARVHWDYVLEIDPDRKELKKRYDKAFREESVEYDFNRWKSRHFSITYPPGITPALRSSVASILDRAYVDIGRLLGGIYPAPPIYVVLYTAEQFTEATRLDGHIGAVYDGKIRSPLTNGDGDWLPQEELKRRLVHEYIHVVVRNITGDKIPWWLNEGLAEALSRNFESNDVARLKENYATGAVYSFSQLSGNQVSAKQPEALRNAYLQSHAAVDLLWNRFGRPKMLSLLRALGSGTKIDEAFQLTYRRTLEDFEWELAAQYQ